MHKTELRYTVLGDPRTKKNHQKIAGAGRRCPVCGKFEKQWVRQGSAHDKFADMVIPQLIPRPPQPIEERVNVRYLFYMKTRRVVDESNLIAAMDDILVDSGILADDNCRIVAGHDGTRVRYDKENPRCEITITTMTDE